MKHNYNINEAKLIFDGKTKLKILLLPEIFHNLIVRPP